jgi:hypothetical protein
MIRNSMFINRLIFEKLIFFYNLKYIIVIMKAFFLKHGLIGCLSVYDFFYLGIK